MPKKKSEDPSNDGMSKRAKKAARRKALEVLRQAKEREEQFQVDMKRSIEILTQEAKEKNDILKMKFYLLHINYSYFRELENEQKMYYPAEICIAECCLLDGIKRTFNKTISQEVAMGYSSTVKEVVESTHQIQPDDCDGVKSYYTLFDQIYHFLEPDINEGLLPPLYARTTDEHTHPCAKSVLFQLAQTGGQEDYFFPLYDFEFFSVKVLNSLAQEWELVDINDFENILKKDPYVYDIELACNHHNNKIKKGQSYCSQSFVKRWFFALCDEAFKRIDKKLEAGIHKPLKQESPAFVIHEGSSEPDSQKDKNRRRNRTFNTDRPPISVLSETGVRESHRIAVSERTYREELQRRREAEKTKLKLTDTRLDRSPSPSSNTRNNNIHSIHERNNFDKYSESSRYNNARSESNKNQNYPNNNERPSRNDSHAIRSDRRHHRTAPYEIPQNRTNSYREQNDSLNYPKRRLIYQGRHKVIYDYQQPTDPTAGASSTALSSNSNYNYSRQNYERSSIPNYQGNSIQGHHLRNNSSLDGSHPGTSSTALPSNSNYNYSRRNCEGIRVPNHHSNSIQQYSNSGPPLGNNPSLAGSHLDSSSTALPSNSNYNYSRQNYEGSSIPNYQGNLLQQYSNSGQPLGNNPSVSGSYLGANVGQGKTYYNKQSHYQRSDTGRGARGQRLNERSDYQ